MPETFSSDLGDPGRHRGPQDTFNSEFQGASDSLIRKDRPELIGGRGRLGILLVVSIFAAPVLGFCGFALWYWRVPIGNWLVGGEARVEPVVEAEEEPAAVPPDLPSGPPPVFGIRGAPDDSTIEVVETTVRGAVSISSVDVGLTNLEQPLADCWAKAGAAGSVELVVSFGIEANGNIRDVSVVGGTDSLHGCVRSALPSSGWPPPRNGGAASVSRTWKLAGRAAPI